MISEKFTIDDIHKIRYENYEKTKHLPPDEIIKETNKIADKLIARLTDIRRKPSNIT